MRRSSLSSLILMSAFLAACSGDESKPVPLSAEETAAFVHDLRPDFDLSSVLVIRLDIDGQLVEATSLFPVVLPMTLTPRTGAARTWLLFDNDKTILRFVTRGRDGSAQRLDIPVGDLVEGYGFTLPIAQTDGNVTPSRVTVREFIRKP